MSVVNKDNEIKPTEYTVEHIEYLQLFNACFNQQQIAALIDFVENQSDHATVTSNAAKNYAENLRRSKIAWVKKNDFAWLYPVIWNVARKANATYKYDVTPFKDPLQIACYDGSSAGFFEWHMDVIPSQMTRKISISIPLNSRADYEGGDLEFSIGNITTSVFQKPGAPITFPSWLPHRVTPVTKGKRYSLVAWILGPNWR